MPSNMPLHSIIWLTPVLLLWKGQIRANIVCLGMCSVMERQYPTTGPGKACFSYCAWNFSMNGFLQSCFTHLGLVQISSPEDRPVSFTVRHLQSRTAGERLMLMPSMDKQRKFQEPLGFLCLSLNCASVLSSIQRETYCAECFSALSHSEC